MRGIDTSSTATFGWCACVDSSAVDAVLGLGDDLHVGLAVDQHAQARADDAVVVRDQHADQDGTRWSWAIRSVTVVPPPGAERTSSSPPARRARSAMPLRPRPAPGPSLVASARQRGRVEAGAVVAHVQLEPLVAGLDVHRDGGGAGVAADVGERLLEDPVDRRLHVLGERVGRRRRR